MCLENFQTQGKSVLVCHYCCKLLLASRVNHGTKRVVAWEKWKQRALVHHEIEGFVNLSVTLLHGSLIHLLNEFILIHFVIQG